MNAGTEQLKEVFLGRQPILDGNQATVGYELLFRPAPHNRAEAECPGAATADVVCKAFAELGLASALSAQKAFINVDEAFLGDDAVELLPRHQVVLEISPGPAPPAPLLQRVRELRARGYEFCLCWSGDPAAPGATAADLASYVKIDIGSTPPGVLKALAARFRGGTARLIAARVESVEDMRRCAQIGFHLFQGYYFAKPVIIEGRKLDPTTQGLIRLVNLLAGDADVALIEAGFKNEPALLVNLLRLTNSVGVGLNARIASVRHAIAVVGRRQLQRWLQLLLFSGTGEGLGVARNPLLQLAALRGRLIELLAERHSPSKRELQDLAFITGLMSLMPAALGMPMTEILAQIAVAPEARRALSRREGDLGLLLELTERYDNNDMDGTAALLERTGGHITFQALGACLTEAIAWVQQLAAAE